MQASGEEQGMTDKPAPLVPAHIDLRDFEFMPLRVVRLRDSDLVTYSSGDEFKAAVILWCAAWHQMPAGSLPDDDRWLAKHSGAGLGWKKLRAGALRGWLLCSDGRLHHAVLAHVVLASWKKKQEQRAKTLKARIAAAQKRVKEACEPVDKHHSQTILDGLLQELSQTLAPGQSQTPVTLPVTSTKESEVEVKGSSSKPAVEQTPDIPSTSKPPDGRIDKRLNGKGKATPRESWATLAWATASSKTFGTPRIQGESDDLFIDRICTVAEARRREAKHASR
jgi:hypothetical protein